MTSDINKDIVEHIKNHPLQSSKEIYDSLGLEMGYATIKRALTQLLSEKLIATKGKGKGTKYLVSSTYELLYPVDVENYFKKEQDERQIKDSFNLSLITDILRAANLFTGGEQALLQSLHTKFKKNIAGLSTTEYGKEMERLAIDLSWKSSQIEGNTYTLLETERLLKEKETALEIWILHRHTTLCTTRREAPLALLLVSKCRNFSRDKASNEVGVDVDVPFVQELSTFSS